MAATIDDAKSRGKAAAATDSQVGRAEGPTSSIHLRETVIETVDDTLWWLETLTAMLLDGDEADLTDRVPPSSLLERMRYVLDVLRGQISSRRLALHALAVCCAPALSARAGQLELDYRALTPLIARVDVCATRVAEGRAAATRHSADDLTLTWIVTQLIDFTELALLGEQELVLLMHTHYAGDGP